MIYCGHEYTLSNAKFAFHLNPSDKALEERVIEIEEQRDKKNATIPARLGEEKKFNPFLNFDNQEYLKMIGVNNQSNLECFTKIRTMKDNF